VSVSACFQHYSKSSTDQLGRNFVKQVTFFDSWQNRIEKISVFNEGTDQFVRELPT